jgi:hypothetical protein
LLVVSMPGLDGSNSRQARAIPPAGRSGTPRGGGVPRRLVVGLDYGQRVVERRELCPDDGQASSHLLCFIGKLITFFRERARNSA